jgi:hypothetical protein
VVISVHKFDKFGVLHRTMSIDVIPATKSDVEQHFAAHGTGKITEIKLMNGFGFIEYEDAMDARDVVPGESSVSYEVSCARLTSLG